MRPVSIEEKIVCYADKFFTKKDGKLSIPKKPVKILKKLEKYLDITMNPCVEIGRDNVQLDYHAPIEQFILNTGRMIRPNRIASIL